MRIAIANKYARVTGGADRHCLELASGLRIRGHEVMFLSTSDEANVDRSGFFVPATVTNDSRGDAKGVAAARIAGNAFWNPRAAVATREMLDSFRPEILHVHKLYPQLSVAPVVLARRYGVPIVQTIHDYEFVAASPLDHSGGWLDRNEIRVTYRMLNSTLFGIKRGVHVPRVDKWISVSRSTSNAYHERGIATTVLPNFTKMADGECPQFADRRGILFIGRLSEEKGVHHVLDLPRRLDELPILIAGDGSLLDEVQHATQVFPCMTYLGKLDREGVAREIASARLVVMPSLCRDSGPLAALEAMAAGTPLIAYDNGGLAEYVADAGAGIVVPPTVSSLAGAIESLYDDRERWEEFSCNALRAVKSDHSMSLYLDRLEAIYTELLSA